MKAGASENDQDGNVSGPSFIHCSPLGEDLLEGKSQEQIAEGLSKLILTNRSEHRLIGLDGTWGSGKSNLVKILESKLTDTHHVFIYDAWGHQEDLQRRSFLEELTADLCDKKIVDPDIWCKKLKELLSRKRETLTKTVPHLSYGVIVTLLIVIFTPIAKAIADGFDEQYAKILITSLPFIVGVCLWIFASFKARHILSVPEIYRLYKEADLVNETQVTISEKEPSVREFQNWMKDLSKSLTKKKLIVVFDNMDRLPPDRVRELWSSIHTFFAEDSFDGIWVIIPFDRKHIADAFSGKEDVADQFLNKSFSVIYRVAPPVLTDWQKFFDLKYKDAFKAAEGDELLTVRRTFDLLNDQITPRSIIAFINEIVSLRLVVENDILLRYIAIFVLAKKQIQKAPVDQILNLDFLQKAEPLFREDKDLPNHIAALVYHVPLASASQVSLTREIQTSLRDKNGARFNELAKHRYFIDILEQVIAGDDLDVASSAATISMLDNKHLEDDGTQERITTIWDNLCTKELKTPLNEQKFTTTHELLLKYSSTTTMRALAARIVLGVRNTEQFDGEAYYQSLFQLDEYLKKNKLDIDVMPLVTEIKKPPEIFIDYIRSAGSSFKIFKLKCDKSELYDFILARIPTKLEGLAVLAVVNKEYDFKPVIEKLEENLIANSLTADTIEPFYKLYKAITTDKPIKAVQDSHINTLLPQLPDGSEGQIELLAMRLARGPEFPNLPGITQTILTDSTEETANRIAEIIEYYTAYGSLLINFVSWTQPLLKAVLRDLTLNRYGSSKLSITLVLKHFNTLTTSLDIEPEDFINRLDGWTSRARDEITADNITEIVADYEFFEHAVESDSELAQYLIEVMITHLESLSVDDWLISLRDINSYIFNVTYWLLWGEQLKSPPDNAITVYKILLIEVAKGEFEMVEDTGWDIFYNRTHKGKLKATAKNIRDLFISETAITVSLFLTFSDLLTNYADLKEKSADVARKILAPVALDKRCLAFIVENGEFFASLVNEAGDDAGDLKDIVRQKILMPECNIRIIDFARTIGIDPVVDPQAGDTASQDKKLSQE